MRIRIVYCLIAMLLPGAASSYAQTSEPALRATLEQLRGQRPASVAGERLTAFAELAAVYKKRQYRPLWTSAAARTLLSAVQQAETHGLQRSDYHLRTLSALISRAATGSAEVSAQFEVLASDALLRYAHDLRYGKVDPEKLFPRWSLTGPHHVNSLLDDLVRAVEQESVGEWLATLVPSYSVYPGMRNALARYRALVAQGGWPTLSAGSWLQIGDRHPRVLQLRERLKVTGDLPDSQVLDPTAFDAELDRAVRIFQRRHGLAVDGIVGPKTRAALNVPAELRVKQLRINLERARWVLHNIIGRTVVVNLAGFSAYLAEDDRVQWSSRVVIGRTYRKTPIFRSQIRNLVLNPSWVVPPTIFKQDILPLAIKDPAAVRKKGLKVLSGSQTEIPPEAIDWQRYLSAPFPYKLRQDPGPNNALGRIKFVFPNPYTVFMHDTPQREFFERPDRAFSSGCIRLQKPMELAALLLSGAPDWDRRKLLTAVNSGRTQAITLPRPVDIVVMYWTAGVDPWGIVHFRNDIYKRDPAVLAALQRAP